MTGEPVPEGGPAFVAVVLAAGRARRLGGRCKPLFTLDGEPLVRRMARECRRAGAREVVVVTGPHAPGVAAAIAGLDPAVRAVVTPRADDGPLWSLRAGLAALDTLDAGDPWVVVGLADQPLVEASHLGALLGHATTATPQQAMVVPCRGPSQPGNPVALRAALARVWRDDPSTPAGAAWRDATPDGVCWWITHEAAFHTDVDTDADLAQFEQTTGRRLAPPVPREENPA